MRTLALPLAATLAFNVVALDGAYRLQARMMVGENNVRTAHGSCVAIGKRKVLTAAHNIEDGYECYIELRADEWVRAKVVRKDDEMDLALLELSKDAPKHVKVGQAERLLACGSPQAKELRDYSGEVRESLTTLDIDVGCSGGPVLNAKGELVGIISRMLVHFELKNGTMEMIRTGNSGVIVGIGNIRKFLDKEK